MALELRRVKASVPRLKRDGRRIVWLPTVIAALAALANALVGESSFRIAEQAGQVILIGFLTSIYIFEPFWRMRMIAALGLALAALMRRAGDGMLIGMVFTLAISLIQLGALAAIIVAMEVNLQSGFVLQCFVPMVLIVIFMVSWYVYSFVRYRSLEFALRCAFQLELRDL